MPRIVAATNPPGNPFSRKIHKLLAAAYGFGLARNHPHVDGNKRIAFVAMAVFLGLNGLEFSAAEDGVVTTIVALASGTLDEDALADWVQLNSRRLGESR